MNNDKETVNGGWETVIGLEVHVELATATKLFSAAPARFGDDPNTNITPVCLGLPGSLPVLNRHAVELAMTIGLALDCEIGPSVFHRKNYFYPDMPKDFQVSQYDEPICRNGRLELASGAVIGIERAHLEEDAGKSTHIGGTDGRIHGADGALLDYNRAGIGLLEIVSRPEISSATDARGYVEELRAILRATGTSNARLEEGSMRVDANISVRPAGSDELRTRCEVKNLNSLRSLTRAIEYEARRHIELYEAADAPRQETRHWAQDGHTHPLRSKEDAHDYRYFPEPDLVLLDPDPEWIERVRVNLPELPAAKRSRLVDAGVSVDDAVTLTERGQADLVLSAMMAGAPVERAATLAVNNLGDFVMGAGFAVDSAADFAVDSSGGSTVDNFADFAADFARLVALETDGSLTATQAKQVLAEMVAGGGSPDDIAAALGFEAMDDDDLAALVDEAIAANSKAWQKFCAGEEKVAGVFVGAVMAATRGQADGQAVTTLLKARRDG